MEEQRVPKVGDKIKATKSVGSLSYDELELGTVITIGNISNDHYYDKERKEKYIYLGGGTKYEFVDEPKETVDEKRKPKVGDLCYGINSDVKGYDFFFKKVEHKNNYKHSEIEITKVPKTGCTVGYFKVGEVISRQTLWDGCYKPLCEAKKLDKIIVHCPEKSMYEKLVEVVGWASGNKNLNNWDSNESKTSIKIDNSIIDGFSRNSYYKDSNDYKDYEKLHFNEFMDKYFPEEQKPSSLDSDINVYKDKKTGTKYHHKSEGFKFSEKPVKDWMSQEYSHPIKITGHEDIEEVPIFKRDGVNFIKVPKDFYKPFNPEFFYGKSLADSLRPKPTNIINKIKNFMLNTLTPALKRALNKDMQAQYRAGLINGGMELTEEGSDELQEILCQENQEKLTARAKDIIAEEEKKNKK